MSWPRDRMFGAQWRAARERWDKTRAEYAAAIAAVGEERIGDALGLCEGALERLVRRAKMNGHPCPFGYDERALDQVLALTALLAEGALSAEWAVAYGERARELLRLAARLRAAAVVGHDPEAHA